MDSMKQILEDAKRLHDESVRLLAKALAGKVVPKPGYTQEDVIEALKQDIAGSRKLIERLGWRDNA